MNDYTKLLPEHMEMYIGENDLFLEIYQGVLKGTYSKTKPPLLFLHGAYTGSWMWSKLTMEAGKAFSACSITFGASEGIPIDNTRITCPALVIRTANNEEEEHRLKVEADYFHGDYAGMKPATHTGLLVGQKYHKGVEVILKWLERF